MGDLISFSEVKGKARLDYVDPAAIEAGCELIEGCVNDIAKGSMQTVGAIDTLAYEINAHVVAIRRALENASVSGVAAGPVQRWYSLPTAWTMRGSP